MSGYLNYYGRNGDWDNWAVQNWGYTYLGPTLVPPVPTTVGMTDRNGSGTIWFLMWDGAVHLVLTTSPPRPFTHPNGASWNTTAQTGQDVRVYGAWDGPFMGVTGARLGVLAGRLQFDFPTGVGNAVPLSAGGPVIVAPYIGGPQQQSYPEPTNFPAPGVPSVPGIPSSTPVPTGGGLAAFLAAYPTNTPPLVVPVFTGTEWTLEAFGI